MKCFKGSNCDDPVIMVNGKPLCEIHGGITVSALLNVLAEGASFKAAKIENYSAQNLKNPTTVSSMSVTALTPAGEKLVKIFHTTSGTAVDHTWQLEDILDEMNNDTRVSFNFDTFYKFEYKDMAWLVTVTERPLNMTVIPEFQVKVNNWADLSEQVKYLRIVFNLGGFPTADQVRQEIDKIYDDVQAYLILQS